MATPKLERPPQPPRSAPTIDHLSFIDLSTLTQSELLSLSRCSSSASSSAASRFSGDIAAAFIDRSAFNESAGSRRQIFFRPGPSSPSSSVHHRSRVAVAGRLSSSSAKKLSVSDAGIVEASGDPHHGENRRIIANLKQSLRNLPEFYDIDFDYVPLSSFTNPSMILCDGGGERKRKRGRKPKPKSENFKPEIQKSVSATYARNENTETGLEIVNKNGVRIDLVALGSLEDPYGPEIRRRTEGLCGEEELLGFLSGLGGEWCSRRRKRKIVDAGVLGEYLPVGWKLLLALKRKERRAWVYCRRIVSPGGRHFLSCKEVSEYLRSYFEFHGEQSIVIHDRSRVQLDGRQSAPQIQNQDAIRREDSQEQFGIYHSFVSGSDNFEEVQVQNLFKCQKCNSTFEENDKYLQHLTSVHQDNAKRCRIGSSVEDDETINVGNDDEALNVGIDDEGEEQLSDQLSLQQMIEPTRKDDSGMRVSRMDALIEIAHNSMLETSSAPATEATERFMSDEPNLLLEGMHQVSYSENEMISPGAVETEDGLTINNLDKSFQGEINETTTGEKMENLERIANVVDMEVDSQLNTPIVLNASESIGTQSEDFPEQHGMGSAANRTEESVSLNEPTVESCLAIPAKNQELFGVSLAPPTYGGDSNGEQAGLLTVDFGPTDNTVPFSGQIRDSLHSQLLPSQDLQTCENVSKGEDKYGINPSNDRVMRYGELQLDYMESLKINFVGSRNISLVPMGLEDTTAMVDTAYGSVSQFQPQELALGLTGGSNNLTTICMWCGIEFSHGVEVSEPRLESIGYVCLACKARISGQIGTPDATTSTMTSHLF